jgi:hypothetical protein
MNRLIDCDAMQIDIEVLTTTREGGVIWVCLVNIAYGTETAEFLV